MSKMFVMFQLKKTNKIFVSEWILRIFSGVIYALCSQFTYILYIYFAYDKRKLYAKLPVYGRAGINILSLVLNLFFLKYMMICFKYRKDNL